MSKKEKRDSKKKKKIDSDVYGDEFEGDQETNETEIEMKSSEDVELEEDTEEQLYR